MFRRLSDLISPPACAGCGSTGVRFCASCVAQINWLTAPICKVCGTGLEGAQTLCFRCMRFRPKFSIRSAAYFDEPLRSAVHALKYQNNFGIAPALSKLMTTAWETWRHDIDVVMPVPLHPERFRERGYNQSELLAKAFADSAELPLITNTLFRSKYTKPQAGLTATTRRNNVQDAFSVLGDVDGQRILLIDDVVTTGSTLSASADVLLDAGAATVSAYCLARARNPGQYEDELADS